MADDAGHDQIVDETLAELGLTRTVVEPEVEFPIEHACPGPFCPHNHFTVDKFARKVLCGLCGVALDPIDVLFELSLNPTWIKQAYVERRRVDEEVRALRVEVSKLRAARRAVLNKSKPPQGAP